MIRRRVENKDIDGFKLFEYRRVGGGGCGLVPVSRQTNSFGFFELNALPHSSTKSKRIKAPGPYTRSYDSEGLPELYTVCSSVNVLGDRRGGGGGGSLQRREGVESQPSMMRMMGSPGVSYASYLIPHSREKGRYKTPPKTADAAAAAITTWPINVGGKGLLRKSSTSSSSSSSESPGFSRHGQSRSPSHAEVGMRPHTQPVPFNALSRAMRLRNEAANKVRLDGGDYRRLVKGDHNADLIGEASFRGEVEEASSLSVGGDQRTATATATTVAATGGMMRPSEASFRKKMQEKKLRFGPVSVPSRNGADGGYLAIHGNGRSMSVDHNSEAPLHPPRGRNKAVASPPIHHPVLQKALALVGRRSDDEMAKVLDLALHSVPAASPEEIDLVQHEMVRIKERQELRLKLSAAVNCREQGLMSLLLERARELGLDPKENIVQHARSLVSPSGKGISLSVSGKAPTCNEHAAKKGNTASSSTSTTAKQVYGNGSSSSSSSSSSNAVPTAEGSYSNGGGALTVGLGGKERKKSDQRTLANMFEVTNIVGEGAYGVVMRCRRRDNGHIVAVKEFKVCNEDPDADEVRRTTRREVMVLRQTKHPFIVQYREDFYVGDSLYIVMEFVPRNLLEILEAETNGLTPKKVRKYIFQLCQAIDYLHSRNIIYRDVKPENLLITDDENLKLCDFGFARHVNSSDEQLTDYVATRWYRAPELLLGPPYLNEKGREIAQPYGKAVDVWAIGCLMGELLDGEPMFAGDSDLDQLVKIQETLGELTGPQQAFFSTNPNNADIELEQVEDPITLRSRYLGIASEVELDFMEMLLKISPERRLTCNACLRHRYFQSITRTPTPNPRTPLY